MSDKFDLKSIDTVSTGNRGMVMEFLHPKTNLPTGVKITLAGADSTAYQKAENAWANKQRNRMIKQRGNPAALMPSAEETKERALEINALCTLSWEGVIYNGQELECNYENALMLYRAFPALHDEVNAFINDRANFLAS